MPTRQKKSQDPERERRPHPGARGFIPPRPEEPRPDANAVYDFGEAAAFLRISKAGVRRLVDAGQIGYLAVNQKQRRILGRQILDFQDRRARGPIR